MAARDNALNWRKSTYSPHGGEDCVEVADLPTGTRLVRDSKNPHGGMLSVGAPAWSVFVTSAKSGHFA
jgi:hypothetical protein